MKSPWVACCAVVVLSAPALAKPQSFEAWLVDLRAEAKAKGLSDATLKALDGVQPIPRVLELDRKQPEGKFTFDQYLEKVLTEAKRTEGRRLYEENRAALQPIADKYKVPAHFLVALWGAETAYGTITGDYSIVAALATLAYDGRRSAFFRKELLAALTILEQGHITPELMKGSWAGAMGQCQFMPTTFLQYAADGDGDGKRDIWTNRLDVWASTAHYLSKLRWKEQQPWGSEVALPEGFDEQALGLKDARPVAEWTGLGVKALDGKPLSAQLPPGAVLKPGGTTARAFLIHDNYRALLKWNRSQYFAALVGMLSDVVKAPAPPAADGGTVLLSRPAPP